MQYLDEYSLYREKFPAGDFLVIRRRGEKIDPSALSEEERKIWKAIEFSQDPQRIFRKACMTWFEGIKALWLLTDRGLVEVSAADTLREDPERAIKEEMVRRRQVGTLRAAAWMVAAAVTVFWAYTILLSPASTSVFAVWVRFF
jgi:predicted Ser/Thr protein kinase